MAGLNPPTAGQVKPTKKKKKNGKAKKGTSGTRARTSAAKSRKALATSTAVTAGEFLGAGAIASGLSAWRATKGADLKLFKTIDGRIVAGLLGLVGGLWKPKAAWSSHAINLGLGALSSWSHEYSYEMGAKWGEAPAAAPTAAEGIVLGTLDGDEDEAGLFGRGRQRRLQRIERKLERLRRRRARIQGRLGYQGEPDYVSVPTWAVRPAYRSRMGY